MYTVSHYKTITAVIVANEIDITIGFSIMMWFVSIILFFVSISLLKGNYSSMHGKIFDKTNNKEEYAKASGKPILFMSIGIAVSGVVATATSRIIISVVIIVCAAIIMGICFQVRQVPVSTSPIFMTKKLLTTPVIS